MAQPQDPPQSKWKFDGTINLPFLVMLLMTVGGAIGFGNKIVGQVDSIQSSAEKQSQKIEKLTESVDNIRLDLAKQDGVRSMVMDHEARIRVIEGRK